jgi:hypothetical protein
MQDNLPDPPMQRGRALPLAEFNRSSLKQFPAHSRRERSCAAARTGNGTALLRHAVKQAERRN